MIRKIKLSDHSIKQFSLFGINLFEIRKDYASKKRTFSWSVGRKKSVKYVDDNVFYLKINSNKDYSFKCLQHWLDIIHEYGADFYIVCDKPEIEKSILKECVFYSPDIKFIKSIKNSTLKKIVKNIATKYWINATYAQLTTFFHSRINGIKEFWNVDADDTMILADADSVADLLKKAKCYAENNNIDAFSIDMHTSRSYYRHWSFGVTFVRQEKDWMSLFSEVKDVSWRKEYTIYDKNMNLDWYMTYLRNNSKADIRVFYAENMEYIHWGSLLFNPIGAAIWKYKQGNILYNIMLDFFHNKELGIVPIDKKSVCVGEISEKNIDSFKENKLTDKINYVLKSKVALFKR